MTDKPKTARQSSDSQAGRAPAVSNQPESLEAAIELLDPTVSKEEARKITHIVELFSGPLPHPKILQGYEDIKPGLAERIVAMAENQAKHRQTAEMKVLDADIRHEKYGMVAGAALTGFAMLVGAVLLMFDKDIAGWVALLGPLGFQGYNYYQQRKAERQAQAEAEEREQAGDSSESR